MLALANTSSQLSDNIGEITAVKSSVSDPPGDKNHSDGDAQTQPSHVCTATIHMRLVLSWRQREKGGRHTS
ncbi:BnaC06g14020D [Brassica napus]|uniref:BnaC06g14020D protein n=1 Tax=Brassica napus TaxID=3708 RepID=A0A078FG12_BRANA|nr:BnaC06g14020D [Brassica napus]